MLKKLSYLQGTVTERNVFVIDFPMSDGNLEIDAQVKSNICYLIGLRH